MSERQKEFYAKEVAISQAKMGRLQIENQLAFAQENERKIALEYYDLQQKIILLRTEKKMTDQDIAKYAEVEKKRIMAMDKELEYQRTFEYGWQKAFATYAENASNSAKMAEQAFVSLQQNLEQTLTTFFETGKINFRSFISSIIHEIARLQAQKAAASILGLFGGGGAEKASQFAGGSFSKGKELLAQKTAAAGATTPTAGPTSATEQANKMSKIKSSDLIKGAVALLILAAALYVAAKAFQEFGSVTWESVGMGLVALAGLATIAFVLSKAKGAMIEGALAIAILGAALIPFAFAMNLLQGLNTHDLISMAHVTPKTETQTTNKTNTIKNSNNTKQAGKQ